MGPTGRNAINTAIDVVHDIAAGLFPGAVLGAWLYQRALGTVPAAGTGASDPTGPLLMLLVADMVVLVGTGLARLNHWQLNVRSGFLETKARLAVAKHVVFVLVLVLSAVALFRLAS